MTPTLLQFYKDWLVWAEDGGHASPVFYPNSGLCPNLKEWIKRYFPGIHTTYKREILDELTAAFDTSGLRLVYPFGGFDYMERMVNGTMHECPKRLAWVREQIAKGE